MELQKATVIPLHHDWKFLEICCKLINEEWPRSTTARMHSLEVSCDNLPTSLILLLVEDDTNEEVVIGHCKISPVSRCPYACFVESVVISKKFRGKGWGRYIMQETEKYVKTKGKTVIYLSTDDKEQFYTKLGYTKCDPVSMYGCKTLDIGSKLRSLLFLPKTNNKKAETQSRPPPPPPLPSFKTFDGRTKVYMMKVLL